VYFLLAVVVVILAAHSGNHKDASQQEQLLWVQAFLAWRVSRGGWLSRVLLICISFGSYLACAFSPELVVNNTTARMVIFALQVALLISTPVYGRTRRPRRFITQDWSQLLLHRPAAWLLPVGLLAGVVVTLIALGHEDFVTVAGCRPAWSDACTAVAKGYPLEWLTAYQNRTDSVISTVALLSDYVHWALACTSLLYLWGLWSTAPRD